MEDGQDDTYDDSHEEKHSGIISCSSSRHSGGSSSSSSSSSSNNNNNNNRKSMPIDGDGSSVGVGGTGTGSNHRRAEEEFAHASMTSSEMNALSAGGEHGRRHAAATGLAEKADGIVSHRSPDHTRLRPPAVVTPRQPSSWGGGSSMKMTSSVKVAPMASRMETKQVIQQMDVSGGKPGGKLHDMSGMSAQGVGDLAARNWLLSKGQKKTLKLLKKIRSPEGFLHRAGLSMILSKLEVQNPEPLLDRLHELSDVPNTSKDFVSQTIFLKWVGFEL